MNKTYYLFRHGLATTSKYGYGKKIVTATLLPQGLGAVQRIGEYLKQVPESFNVCSNFIRCKQTAAIISEITGKQFVYDDRLNERHHELFSQLKERIYSIVTELEKNEHEHIVICTHAIVIAGFKHFLLENKYVSSQRFDYPKEGELVIIKNKEFQKISFNKLASEERG